jgi:hypothetical protein
MKLEMAIAPTRLLAMCLGPEAGAPSIFAKSRAGALVRMKSRLRSKPLRFNPIEVHRAAGYGRRLLFHLWECGQRERGGKAVSRVATPRCPHFHRLAAEQI